MIKSVIKDQKPWPDCYDMISSSGRYGAVLFDDVLEECRMKKFDGASHWSPNDWTSILAKGGGAKKRFEYCLNPNSPSHFLFPRAIQGHSGGNAIDSELQDNVLPPEGLTEYIYHVGNVSEIHSIIRSGFIPGGRSPKRGRQSVFFTFTNPMDDDNGMGETPCDLTKPRRAPYNKYLDTSSTHGILVQFQAHSGERTAILPKTVTCNRSLQHTAHRLHWENGMYENEGGALPKRTLNSKIATSCTQSEFAQWSTGSTRPRPSGDTPSVPKSSRWTLNNAVDYIIPCIPLSTVEQQDTNRKDKVKKLIEKFESHQHKESFLDANDQQVQQRIAGARRHEQHRDIRALRNFFQKTMPRLQYLLGNRYCLLQLWKKHEIFEETTRARAEQPWRLLNPWLCY